MRIAKVVGSVTLNRCHPSFVGANLKLVIPMTTADLVDEAEPASETLVCWDELGAGEGNYIAMSEGPEAAQPFRPEIKPVDASNAAILDSIDVNQPLARRFLK
jgi:ethanolamine utilization protein EutN